MKTFLISQGAVTLIGWLLLYGFNAPQRANSFAAGSLLILLSFFLMGLAWGFIFQKKLIALSIGIIVFKYAILGIIIFTLVKQTWFDTLWFSLGVASLILSAFVYGLKEALREGKDNVI